MRYPIPKALLAAATVTLDGRLRTEAANLETDGNQEHVRSLYETGKNWGYQPERTELETTLAIELRSVLAQIRPEANLQVWTARAEQILDVATFLNVAPDLWQAQNQLLDAYAELVATQRLTPALQEAFARLADRLRIGSGLLGWRP
jgi:hypothetical protein